MESSRRDRQGTAASAAVVAIVAMLATACSIGGGEGVINGSVRATDECGLDEPQWALQPSFFAGEVTGEQLHIRVQRGSDFESYADGLMIQVLDVTNVKRQRIGLPIPIRAEPRSLVQVVLYLNETCAAGFPSAPRVRPVILDAVSGQIVFDAVYAPDIDAGATQIEAELIDVHFEDPDDPEERNATLSGWFSFFYQRGSPAQRFP